MNDERLINRGLLLAQWLGLVLVILLVWTAQAYVRAREVAINRVGSFIGEGDYSPQIVSIGFDITRGTIRVTWRQQIARSQVKVYTSSSWLGIGPCVAE